ncbi:hypothetical protein [Tenacibaculum amylolyticum]|uniref:hypothetical protein n=1 Tax=Tenacibaculum amylolyticum TaxID=104269 RepID=UPI0038936CDF
MKKSILELGKVIHKKEQRLIKGQFLNDGDSYGVCTRRFSLDCGVPDHLCCNYKCVLITHPACQG